MTTTLVYGAYLLLLARTIVEASTLEWVLAGWPTTFVRYFCLAAVALKMLSQTYTARQLAILAGVGLVVGVSVAISGANELLLTFGFIAAGKHVSYRRIVALTMTMLALLVPLIIMLSYVGAIQEISFFRAGVLRTGLGFRHPNALGRLVLQGVLCWLILRWKRFGLLDYVGVLAAALLVDTFSASRTSVYLMVIALIVRLTVGYGGTRNVRMLGSVTRVALILVPTISLAFAAWYDPGQPWHRELDRLLSERLTWMSFFFQRDGFSLLGREIDFGAFDSFSVERLVLDNMYVRLAIQSGLVLLVVYIFAMRRSAAIASRRNDAANICAILVFVLFGVFERHSAFIAFNFTIFLLADVLYGPEANEGQGESAPVVPAAFEGMRPQKTANEPGRHKSGWRQPRVRARVSSAAARRVCMTSTVLHMSTRSGGM